MRTFLIPSAARRFMRVARWLGITTTALVLAATAMAFAARAVLRPAPGDWATTIKAGPLSIDVGVAALIQWGTTPWIAEQLQGRTLRMPMGPVTWIWSSTDQQLALVCQPCTLRSSSWGTEPLRLAEVRMTVQRNATELKGTIASGTVTASWYGTVRPGGMTLHIRLPETPVHDAYALFATAIPEVATAQIEGTIALQATLELPSKTLNVQPLLQGMRVSGLGTQQWAQATSACGKKLPAARLRPDSLLARAVIAAEDQRFFEHPGYDLQEMTQALHSNQSPSGPVSGAGAMDQKDPVQIAPVRGASTLSQQVAKLLVTGGQRSPVRKLRELLYAVDMEQTLGKARILSLYLEHAPWGAQVCGAQAAAHTYFGISADQLTAPQAVWLAAMLHNPALEAQRWKATGHINQERAQWVASNMRPMKKAQRAAVAQQLLTQTWPAPSKSGDRALM